MTYKEDLIKERKECEYATLKKQMECCERSVSLLIDRVIHLYRCKFLKGEDKVTLFITNYIGSHTEVQANNVVSYNNFMTETYRDELPPFHIMFDLQYKLAKDYELILCGRAKQVKLSAIRRTDTRPKSFKILAYKITLKLK